MQILLDEKEVARLVNARVMIEQLTNRVSNNVLLEDRNAEVVCTPDEIIKKVPSKEIFESLIEIRNTLPQLPPNYMTSVE